MLHGVRLDNTLDLYELDLENSILSSVEVFVYMPDRIVAQK